MNEQIIECIANYSEGRQPDIIEEIINSIESVTGVFLLDRHSDIDHNRSVLTFIGSIPGIEEAAFRSIKKAAELINLDHQRGEHPRIGATDVVPFVPISGATMDDCISLAKRLGQRVGHELNIPVYLYEKAAQIAERENLENIRRGEYESLKLEIETNPTRKPDYGPSILGTAGATVIGARHPLIAFNVYLTTNDLAVAKKIAKAIRYSSGGLRYVKALGMIVDGRAQVSMNLTNYHATPIARVVTLIQSEANRFGVGIHHSELVGLIPQDALIDAAIWHLQLDQFEKEQILENRLNQILFSQKKNVQAKILPEQFLDDLSSATPTPGGGSASAYCAAQAAALVAMVARLSTGKNKYASIESEMQEIIVQADSLRNQMTKSVVEDANAYKQVMESYKLPKETEQEISTRLKAIEKSILGAIESPLKVAQGAVKILELAESVIRLGNINAICDGGTAAALAQAALKGAILNIQTNVLTLPEQDDVKKYRHKIIELKDLAEKLEHLVSTQLAERGGLTA